MSNFLRQLRVEFQELRFHETTDPALAVAEFSCKGTSVATGNPYGEWYLAIVSTCEGKISRYVDFRNLLVAMHGMGMDMNGAFG